MKFKRPKTYKHRSIPLKSCRQPAWYKYGAGNDLTGRRPVPRQPPTEDCFHADGTWYAYDKHGVCHKITGEPKDKPKFVRIHSQLTMYWFENLYWFVEINLLTRLCSKSVAYQGRDRAIHAYRTGSILWMFNWPLRD